MIQGINCTYLSYSRVALKVSIADRFNELLSDFNNVLFPHCRKQKIVNNVSAWQLCWAVFELAYLWYLHLRWWCLCSQMIPTTTTTWVTMTFLWFQFFYFFILGSNCCSLLTYMNHSLHDWLLKEREFQCIWQWSHSKHLLLRWVMIKKDSHLDSISFLVSTLSSWTRNEDKDEENQQSHEERNKRGKEESRHHSENPPSKQNFRIKRGNASYDNKNALKCWTNELSKSIKKTEGWDTDNPESLPVCDPKWPTDCVSVCRQTGGGRP